MHPIRHLLAPLTRPRPALLLLALFTALMGGLALEVGFDGSTQRILAQTPAQQAYQHRMERIFGGDHTCFVALHPPEGDCFAPRVLAKVARLTRELAAIPGVDRVTSLANVRVIDGSADGLTVHPLMAELPRDPGARAALRARVLGDRLLRRNLISDDGRYTSLVVELDPSPAGLAVRDAALAAIDRVVAAAQGPEAVVVAGAPMTGHVFRHRMARDLARLVPLTLLVVAGSLWLLFHRPRAVLLPTLAVAAAMVWTLGLMRLARTPLSMITTALPPVLIAVGVAYGVHVLAAYWGELRAGHGRDRAVRRALRRVAWPLALSAVTTVAGFGSIAASPIRTLREFGTFAMAGVAFSAVLALTLVPLLLAVLPEERWERWRRRRRPWPLDRWLRRIGRFSRRERLAVVAAALLLLLLSAGGIARLVADTDYLAYLPQGEPIRQAAELFNRHLAGATTFTVVLEGDRPGRMKRADALAFLADLGRFLEDDPAVETSTSLADFVAVMNRALHGGDPAYERVPADDAAVGQLLLLFSLSEGAEEILRPYVSYDGRLARLTYRSHLTSSRAQVALADRIEAFCRRHAPPGVRAVQTGSAYYLAASSVDIVRSQARSLGLTAAVIAVIMLALFRSLRATVLILVPNLLPIAMVLGLMGWWGIALSTGTAIIASISLGIAVDDTLHLVLRYREELARRPMPRRHGTARLAAQEEAMAVTLAETGRPVFYTTVTLVAGFSVLAASGFVPVQMLGVLTATTMVFCLFGDLLLLPALLTLIPAAADRRTAASEAPAAAESAAPAPRPARPAPA
ncbi:MAG: hypothetical protein D6739_06285, partial [Nitrospirae bacterium]